MATPSPELIAAVYEQSTARGIDPAYLMAVIGYETGGTYNPNIWGGKGGDYFGLIQFGPNERDTYGVSPGMPVDRQVAAALNYLEDRGYRPGMSLRDMYSTVNAGRPGLYTRSDGNGTVRSHAEQIERRYLPQARSYVETYGQTGAQRAAGNMANGGVRGDPDVFQLQQVLARAGYDPGRIDGIMGPRTEAAVQAYRTAEMAPRSPFGTGSSGRERGFTQSSPYEAARYSGTPRPSTANNTSWINDYRLAMAGRLPADKMPVMLPGAARPAPAGPPTSAPAAAPPASLAGSTIPQWAITALGPDARPAQTSGQPGAYQAYLGTSQAQPPGRIGQMLAGVNFMGKLPGTTLGNLFGIQAPQAASGRGGLLGTLFGDGTPGGTPMASYQTNGGNTWSWTTGAPPTYSPYAGLPANEYGQANNVSTGSGGGGLGALISAIFGGNR